MEFRDAVKFLRNELGLTQMELANALHITATTIVRWEKGQNLPNRSISSSLVEFARASNVSVRCLTALRQSVAQAAEEKLFFSKDNLYSVEHSSLRQLIDEVSFPLYVSDMSNDQLLYANAKAQEMMGCELDKATSLKCYQCLMHQDIPCAFCNKNQLQDNSFTCSDASRMFDGKHYKVYGKRIKWSGRDAQVRYIIQSSNTSDAQSLQEAERFAERLSVIIDNINSGVVAMTVNADGNIELLFVTDKYYELLGYTRAQYYREIANPINLIHKDDVEAVRQTVTNLKKIGDTSVLAYRAMRRDNTIIWLQVQITVISFADYSQPVLLCVFNDVTQSVEATERIAVQRDEIKEMLNTTPSGIAVVEINPQDVTSVHTTYYNERFYSFSGYTGEEYDALLRGNEFSFVLDEDTPILIDSTLKICAGEIGNSDSSVVRCRTKEGGYRWLLLTGQLAEKRGEICILVISMVDITPRKEAEDRVRINEELLRIAAETDKRTIITYDVKANVCKVESRNLYSAKYGEVLEDIPNTFIDTGIIAEESTANLCELFNRIQSGESYVSTTLSLRTNSKEYQWFECNATTVSDVDGKPDKAVLVFHNITEQRVKEAVYRKWQNSLKTRSPQSYTLFRCNLSRDSGLDEQDGELFRLHYGDETSSFDERTKQYAEQYVYPKDRETYSSLLCADNLLAMFYRDERSATLEYRELDEKGEPKWRLLTVEMVEYLNSTDIQAFLLYEDIDERKNAELEEIERKETDPLTGVLNRVAFTKKIEALLNSEAGSQHALLMMDMDGFKQLNDTFGHAAGDQALLDTASVMRAMVRDGDLICRLGGDEFLIWLRGIAYDAVIDKIANGICEQVRKVFSHEVQLSGSVGIAIYPRDGHDFDELYHNADKALYRVKQTGKDNYAFYSTSEQSTAQATTEMRFVAKESDSKTKRRMLIVDGDSNSRANLEAIFKDDYLIETAKNGSEAMVCLRHFNTAVSIVLIDLVKLGADGYAVLNKMQSNVDTRTIPAVVINVEAERDALLKAMEYGAADYVTKPIDADLIRLRVKSAVSKAENERLRAQNSYLQLQRDEEAKFHIVLESTGTVIVEYDWHNRVFVYANDIEKRIAGQYNHRPLWQVFLSDMVASSDDVKALQDGLLSLANDRDRKSFTRLVMLKTPSSVKHWFRMNIYKQVDAFGLAEKMIITFNDVHEEVLSNEKLLFQATRDQLTGLYNRAGFIAKAEELIAEKPSGYYVMSCIDIEKFKVINDQFGTEKGDAVLRDFGKVLAKLNNGEEILCCRVMADYFAVLYPAALLNSSELTKNHTAAEILDGSLPPLRIYIGRCIIDDKTLDVNAIYDRAAIAKDTVKGRYDAYIATYDESMRAAILRQQEITSQMKQALTKGQFEVWLQPQFNHTTGALYGAESLVRWRHPKEGIISPAEFVPIFERNGFIYEVDKFVWEETCKLLRKWLDEGLNPVAVSVNISRYDFFRDDLVEVITALMEKYQLPNDLLRLEITESAFLDSSDRIIRMVGELVELGYVIEIDDFGSGYSSLNTLKDVPAQVLKMDMRFLENDSNAQRGGSIIESVVRMARWLGMSIIAEGVETEEQADYLKSIGCEYVQGYLYAKPMQVDKYENILADRIAPSHEEIKQREIWNNNAFWNPKSMETLIFNSYVGGACIFEYYRGRTELLRYNDSYSNIFRAYMQANMQANISNPTDLLAALDEENSTLIKNNIEKAISTKKESTCESKIINDEGKTMFIRSTIRQIAQAGDRYLFYCVVADITAQRDAEQGERDTASRVAAIMSSVDVGVATYEVSPEGIKILYFNDGYFAGSGYTREQYQDMASKQPLSLVLEEDKPLIHASLSNITGKRDGSPGECTYRCYTKDGECRWKKLKAVVAQQQDSHYILNVVQLDITEQVEAKNRQLELLDSLPNGAALYEYDGVKLTAIHINKSYWELVGRKSVDYTTGSVVDVIYPDDRVAVLNEINSAIRQKRMAHVDARILDGNADYQTFSIRANISNQKNGKYLLYVSYTPINDDNVSLQQMLPLALSTMMATSEDLSFVKDADGRYIACSQSAVSTMGLSSARDVIGKTSYEVFGKQAANYAVEEDEQIFATGKPVLERLIRLPIKGGETATFSTSKYPLLDGKGKVVGIYSSCRNVTAEKDTEFELNTLLRVIPSGILKYSADEKAEFAYVNRNFTEGLGYTEQQFREKFHNCFTEMIWQPDREQAEAEIIAQEQDGQIGRLDYRVQAANGQLHWFHDEGVKVTDENGKEWYYVTLIDITAQKKSEESLRLAEEEYRIATRHSGHTIGRYDVKEQTLTITDDIATRLALPECIPDVPYGRVKAGKISADTAKAYITFYENIMKGEKEGTVTFRKLLSIGWRWITEHSTTIFDEEGNPVSAIISYKDVTEQQEKELAYKKWQQSIKERDPATYTLFRCSVRGKSTFDLWEGTLVNVHFKAAAMTFDERTKAFAEQCVYEDDRQRYITFANSNAMLSAYQCGHRTNSIEYREKLPDDSIRWLKLSVDLVESPNTNDVEAYLLYENIDEQKKAELDTVHQAESDPLTGLFNRKAFAAKANNLMQSSAGDTKHAFLMLDIDGFKMLNDTFGHASGDEALMEVAHKLQSLLRKEDILGRLGGDEFIIFLTDVTSDVSACKKAEQICRQLIKAYGNEITLTTSVGIAMYPHDGEDVHTLYEKADTALYAAKAKGRNTYQLYSLALPKRSAEADKHEMDANTTQPTIAQGKKKYMLLVSDSKVDRTIVKNIFNKEFVVDTATDGMAALSRMRYYGSALSVVLLDLRIAGMGAFEILQKVQNSPELQAIPIVALTNDGDNETCLRAVKHGSTDFVTIPLQPDILRLRVSAAVSRAENERLKNQNNLTQLRNEDTSRYQTALNALGIFVVEMNPLNGACIYDTTISHYLAGVYDQRSLWEILLDDNVAAAKEVEKLRQKIDDFTAQNKQSDLIDVTLTTPHNTSMPFRIQLGKTLAADGLTNKLLLTFRQLNEN